jgi:hypothetical protein
MENRVLKIFSRKKVNASIDFELVQKAKKIFDDFHGRKYHMMHDGVIDEYLSYNISDRMEKEWLKELMENLFKKLDIHNEQTISVFSDVIWAHSSFENIDKLLSFFESNIDNVANQYDMLLYGETIFHLVKDLSFLDKTKQKKGGFSRRKKIRCINLAKLFNGKAEKMHLDENFQIPHFYSEDGLTQQQYVMRRIVSLNEYIKIAMILE